MVNSLKAPARPGLSFMSAVFIASAQTTTMALALALAMAIANGGGELRLVAPPASAGRALTRSAPCQICALGYYRGV